MADAPNLPPLPEPHQMGNFGRSLFATEQMLAYGAECRRLALEEAVRVCENEDVAPSDDPVGVAHCISLAIRALKD